jgi:hypothetical protein
MSEEDESGYLFRNGQIINFEKITKEDIGYGRETCSLRIRTTPNEIDVDFLEEAKPTKEQLETIKGLKTENKKLFFEIVDKKNKHIPGYGGFDKTIEEMEKQIEEFYSKNLKIS